MLDMMLLWSYLLTAVGVAGHGLVGMHKWYGWACVDVLQLLWVVYGLQTGQYGFIIGAIAYVVLYSRETEKWFLEQHPNLFTPDYSPTHRKSTS